MENSNANCKDKYEVVKLKLIIYNSEMEGK